MDIYSKVDELKLNNINITPSLEAYFENIRKMYVNRSYGMCKLPVLLWLTLTGLILIGQCQYKYGQTYDEFSDYEYKHCTEQWQFGPTVCSKNYSEYNHDMVYGVFVRDITLAEGAKWFLETFYQTFLDRTQLNINICLIVYDLSCTSRTQSLDLFIDILLNKTLNNEKPFTIVAIIGDLDTEELINLANVMSAFAIPVISYVPDDSKIKQLKLMNEGAFSNILTVVKRPLCRLHLLLHYITHFRVSLVTLLYDAEQERRGIADQMITMAPQFSVCLYKNIKIELSNINVVSQNILENAYSNFILLLSEDVDLIYSIIKTITHGQVKRKITIFLFFSFRNLNYSQVFNLASTNVDLVTIEDCTTCGRVFFGSNINYALFTALQSLYQVHGIQILKNLSDPNGGRNAPKHFSELLIDNIPYIVEFAGEVTNLTLNHTRSESNKLITRIVVPNHSCYMSDAVDWALDIPPISSVCSEICEPGYSAYFIVPTCCWQCVRCPPNYFKGGKGLHRCSKCNKTSDTDANRTRCIEFTYKNFKISGNTTTIVICLSSIGGIFSAFFIGIFFLYRDTPIVRSSNMTLSMFQLALHLILNAHLVAASFEQFTYMCHIHSITGAYILKLIMVIYIIKTNQLLAIFKSMVKLKRSFFSKVREIIFPTVYLTINIFITVMLHEYVHLTLRIQENKDIFLREIYCDLSTNFYVDLALIMTLTLVCSIQAFRARSLPANYNEMKYIFLGMFTSSVLLCLSIPLHISNSTTGNQILVESVVFYVINIALLTIMYGYKISIILFQKEKNTLKSFRERTANHMMKNVNHNDRL